MKISSSIVYRSFITIVVITLVVLNFKLIHQQAQSQQATASNVNKLIKKLQPIISSVNQGWVNEHNKLNRYYQLHQHQQPLTRKQYRWVNMAYTNYEPFNVNNNHAWHHLMNNVWSLPPSLLIAVALVDSNYGHSKTFLSKNNLYNLRFYHHICYTPIHHSQTQDIACPATLSLKSYTSLWHSIDDFIFHITSEPKYKKLRAIRYYELQHYHHMNSLELANYLHQHTPSGLAYINKVKQTIRKYHLTDYDN